MTGLNSLVCLAKLYIHVVEIFLLCSLSTFLDVCELVWMTENGVLANYTVSVLFLKENH